MVISSSGYPRVNVVPQTPAGPPMSLLDAAILPGPDEETLDGEPMRVTRSIADGMGGKLDIPLGYRWEGGFKWKPRQCGRVSGVNECGPVASFDYRPDAESGIRQHQPVVIQAHNPCVSMNANDYDFQRQSAIDGLIAGEPVAAEAELWDGPLARAAHVAGDASFDSNLWLTKHGVATDVTPTPGTGVTPQRGVGLLEQFLASEGYGSWGTIHLLPEILVHLPYDLRYNGRQLFSSRNTFIVPGSGYSGKGPAKGTTRTVTDGVTNTDTSLVSATAAFVAGDVGAVVTGAGIFAGSTITTVTNGTTVVLSHATTATATGVTVTIDAGVPTAPSAGNVWMYATGRITYRQGDITVVPDNVSEALARPTNALTITAQRSSAGTWDSCAVGAVLVTLPA